MSGSWNGSVGPEAMKRLADHAVRDVAAALARGHLVLHLGPFALALRTDNAAARDFLVSMYANCPVSLDQDTMADFSLHVRPPNLLRRFVRRQVMPDPGFYFPSVPLPPRMGPLALEMGMNMAVALQCFRFAIYHAAVVADETGAIVISANSGGGKSTLAAALMQENFRLLSDEFAIMQPGEPLLLPYPRPVSLKNASVDIVRAFAGNDAMSGVLHGTPKGTIGYRRARKSDIAAMHRPARGRLLLFPTFMEGAKAEVKPVEAGDAVMRFIAGSPNYHVLGEAAYTSLMAFADSIRAYDITYGNTADSVALVRELWTQGGAA